MEEKKGHLKIFFGYCAGVGKTYAMLQEAHVRKKEHVDVVVGYIEPHDRRETMAQVHGLEQLAPKQIQYHGHTWKEFDLDAALLRHPQLILVDELAHTNIPGCRHRKRYSDIEELLRAGIDVYTTINVQHLESLHDVMEDITKVKVQERIPDHIFDQADEVQLIDIETDALLQRLKDGLVYAKSNIPHALQNFFTRDNLTALKQLALRRCADRITSIMPMDKKPFSKEHILVCIGASPTNQRVIRRAYRMAQAFHADFTALYVETSSSATLRGKALHQLEANLILARQLKADIVSTYGDDIAYQISQYAKTSGVSKLVIGRSYHKKALSFRMTLVDQLTAQAPDLEIYIIPDHHASPTRTPLHLNTFAKFTWKETIITASVLIGTTLIGMLFSYFSLDSINIILLYVLASCIIGLCTYYPIYSLASSIISIVLICYLFIAPTFRLSTYSTQYPFIFIILFIVTILISSLTRKLKKENMLAAMHAHSMDILLATSQQLQMAVRYEEIMQVTCHQLYRMLQRVIVYYPVAQATLQEIQFFGESVDESIRQRFTSQEEQTTALWVLKNNKNAGASTSTLSHAHALYLAIRKNTHIFAIIGITLSQEDRLSASEKTMLKAILNETALAYDAVYNQTCRIEQQLRHDFMDAMQNDS